MSNIVAPVTELLIKGKAYKLAFDFAAIEKAEDMLGRGLLSGVFISEEARNPRISTVKAMLYAALQPHQPKTTVAEATALVTQRNFIFIWSMIMKAWEEGLGQPDPDDEPGEATDQS